MGVTRGSDENEWLEITTVYEEQLDQNFQERQKMCLPFLSIMMMTALALPPPSFL